MLELKEKVNIKDLIYEVRGKRVMLDSDLAKLYNYINGAKALNQAVKRNIERFPIDFSFELTKEEYDFIINNSSFLRSHSVTSKINSRGGNRYLHRVFTQEGIAMLSSIIKTKEASKVNVEIMREFVKLKKFVFNNFNVVNDISMMKKLLLTHDNKINELFDKFDKKEELKSKLFYNGEIYDAYSLLIDIISKADKEIIIIDNYVDKKTLDILTKKNINVIVYIITSKKSNITKLDIEKFNSQYPKLEIRYTNIFHDRFIIIDKNMLYHIGASLKDLGLKVFGISKIEDDIIIKELISKLCI